ncbi:MAG: AFG1 family ATPase [Xanthomonadales bacterium]|nr:AFG1 family ATPase [Xanthomonadales bacterium]MCB1634120.1 AFG1 family ATPase [Xanthomonadales bacterium]
MSEAASASPLAAYDAGIDAGRWQDDHHQRIAITELERLYYALLAQAPEGMLSRVLSRFQKPRLVQGLYLWGGVGRGKTFLMDLFYDSLPLEEKLRLHFHRFMGKVQRELAQLKDQTDPLALVAERFAAQTRVLCFDEFFVADIGDAMILGRLLEHLLQRGVALVATSNVPPDGLYRDGLQRARFLPAIALLEQHCTVLHLESPTDYRLRALTSAPLYLCPNDAASEAALDRFFSQVAPGNVVEGLPLTVEGRMLPTRRRADGVVWFDFSDLCEGPRAAADYIEIARSFNTVLISAVPALGDHNNDASRRFMTLVDEFYDRRVNLVLSAERSAVDLYQGERLAFEFQRTSSRLIEMQSAEYLAEAHRP